MEKIPNIPEKLLKSYNPSENEDQIYRTWEQSGFFNPDICIEKGITKEDAEAFSIVLPPPNVTGTLHNGHALMLAIQDTMVRFQRMQGKKTLWIPGTDHAAISTESVVVKQLSKEKISKHDLGREEFLKKVNEFAQGSHDTIIKQLKKMGASLDWSREAFTLDKAREGAVYTAFKQMYDDGLIYRGNRIVNWDPKGQTTVSDDEVDHEPRKAKLYYFKYAQDFPITIATSRPETKLGDTAVAVNPEDPRYQEYIGKVFEINFVGVPLSVKIIADKDVDPEFGTGALGVTPAHSQVDWEMAERHNLPKIQVINEYAKITVDHPEYKDKKVLEARDIIVEKLRASGLLEKEEDIDQNISISQRTGAIIEPLPKLQWFIDVNKKIPSRENKTLKELMADAVGKDGLEIIPERYEKIYKHWIENLRDWCISRQIWYGHRIPVWYDQQGEIHLSKKITVYLARHGETEFNASKIFRPQEIADNTPLTEKGIGDATDLGKSLKDKKITRVIHSTLPRTKQTTEIVMRELGRSMAEVEEWEELKEIRIGENDGKEKPADYNPLKFSVENNIQTLDEVESQGRKIIEKLEKLDDGEHVLIVGHGAINSVVMAINSGYPKEKFIEYKKKQGPTKNGSFYKVNFTFPPKKIDLIQDEDTLDTWFSSGLWTFSTLGWPFDSLRPSSGQDAQDKPRPGSDLATYHPTSVLETGHDILPFWVARMILMSKYLLGEIPFKTAYLHGMVLDKHGKKMSKSNPETAVDPLITIEKYGADALRMAMLVGVGPGSDNNLGEDKIKAYSKFSNKIWNMARFTLENIENYNPTEKIEILLEHKKHIEELDNLISEITKEMEEYKFYLVAEKLYHYVWHTLADKIIEELKPQLKGENIDQKKSAQATIYYLLSNSIKLLHPFMPFITEEIWSVLDKKDDTLLIVNKWPSHV
jgi:valyl-tRNA synthetase